MLVEESKRMWEVKDQDGRRDDITVMMVTFNWDKATPGVADWLKAQQAKK